MMYKCCLRSCLLSQFSLLLLGTSFSGLKGQILKPSRPGGDKPLAIFNFTNFKYKKSTKTHKFAKIHFFQTSLSQNKFKFEQVTGSKQKHMAISSIVGSALSLQYPLYQGLLSKE